MRIQIINIIWQNIPIEISYNNNWSEVIIENYGYAFAHIEIRSKNKQPILITETGYKSHFIPNPEIVEHGGVEKYVLDWLNHTAQSKTWKKYFAQYQQLKLDLF